MKKIVLKRFVTTLAVLACGFCLLCAPISTIPAEAATGEEVVDPAAEILEWVYREVNGKIYKRLMNCSTQQWVGEWIYVCDAP